MFHIAWAIETCLTTNAKRKQNKQKKTTFTMFKMFNELFSPAVVNIEHYSNRMNMSNNFFEILDHHCFQ